MNEIKIFNNPRFGEVRTTIINEDVWFVANDVALVLGYSQPAVTINKKVDSEDKGVSKMETPGGIQEVAIINESGLYSLILSSKLPQAKEFKRWVTSEVLPQIRKTGKYSVGLPQTFAEALRLAADQQEQIENQQKALNEQTQMISDLSNTITDMQQRLSYTDQILASKSTMTVTGIAQDYGMSAKAFNKVLRDAGIQHKVNKQWILYAKFLNCGYVQSKTYSFEHRDGTIGTTLCTEWTQKGRLFLYQELKKLGVLPVLEQSL